MKRRPKTKNRESKARINRTEAYIIAFFIIFGIAWIWLILPWFQYSNFYRMLNPVEAYLVYNIGYITIFTVVFGIPIGFFIKEDINILDMLRGGLFSFIIFSFIADLWAPPLAWTAQGVQAIPVTADNMEATSVDYMAGWVFQQFGVHGSLLYIAVYGIVPIIAVFVMALILKPKELLKYVVGG